MYKQHCSLIAALCLILVCGCGQLRDPGPDRKQIEADIKRQPVRVRTGGGGFEWDFLSKITPPTTCFAVDTRESRITATDADLSVDVSSWSAVQITNKWFYSVVTGKMSMHYKKEGVKWILEKAEPQNFASEKPTNSEEFEQFLQRSMPLCAGKSN